MSETDFTSLGLPATLSDNLSSLGYLKMTEVQAQSLPVILALKDVIAQAKTGSGKTAAFGLGVLQKLDTSVHKVQALILCPTRELADQVTQELRRLARNLPNTKILTLCGGSPIRVQIGSLEHGAHIVVGTPGRVHAHLRKATLDLNSLTTFVLDEADRMLDMGFQEDIDAIVNHLPKRRQNLLFSATFPDEIQKIAQRVLNEPERIVIEGGHDDATIRQHIYRVDENMPRMKLLKLLLLQFQPESALVFCTTKLETDEVVSELRSQGFSALALHGDLDQAQRDQVFVMFGNKSVSVLVATDVAARGLDIDSLDLVINYHPANDVEAHIHRIGRTGRAGQVGVACTLFKINQRYKLDALAEHFKRPFIESPYPPPNILNRVPQLAKWVTLRIDGGRKQKLRPGDILGALTGENGISAKQVGKINITHNRSFVAIDKEVIKPALRKLSEGKLKGRSFRVRRIRV